MNPLLLREIGQPFNPLNYLRIENEHALSTLHHGDDATTHHHDESQIFQSDIRPPVNGPNVPNSPSLHAQGNLAGQVQQLILPQITIVQSMEPQVLESVPSSENLEQGNQRSQQSQSNPSIPAANNPQDQHLTVQVPQEENFATPSFNNQNTSTLQVGSHKANDGSSTNLDSTDKPATPQVELKVIDENAGQENVSPQSGARLHIKAKRVNIIAQDNNVDDYKTAQKAKGGFVIKDGEQENFMLPDSFRSFHQVCSERQASPLHLMTSSGIMPLKALRTPDRIIPSPGHAAYRQTECTDSPQPH